MEFCSTTKHFLDFNHSRNLSGLSRTTSVAGDDPELVFCALGHMGEGVLAHLGGRGVAECPFHLVHLLHLNQVTRNDRTTLIFRWQPCKRD